MPSFLGIEFHIWADGIAFAFAFAAIILCCVQIHHHIYHNHHPETRRYIIRILLMVVVYSVTSWLGLRAPECSLYLVAIRDTYEALVIYSFYQLLIQSLGGYEQVQLHLENIVTHVQPHLWPMNLCCKPWTFTSIDAASDRGTFLNSCSLGILQYCFVQPICAVATFIMQISDVYKEGVFEYNAGYPYIAIIRSASQTWSIYCLALFYFALKKQPHDSDGYQIFTRLKPVNKFLCVKGVVFFSYWQSVLIAGLVWLDFLKGTEKWDEETVAVGLQDFIICIEMCIAAIAHIFAFQISDFQLCEYAPLMAPHRVMLDVANMKDVVGDAKETLRSSTTDILLLKTKRKKNKTKATTQGNVLEPSVSPGVFITNDIVKKREELSVGSGNTAISSTNTNTNTNNLHTYGSISKDTKSSISISTTPKNEENIESNDESTNLNQNDNNKKKIKRKKYRTRFQTVGVHGTPKEVKDDLESHLSDDDAL